MNELHRLTLRQINENPTLMSDEVFVPVEEVDALMRDLLHTSQVLIDFEGRNVWQQAQRAVEYIVWLQNELRISRYQERAALDCLAQSNRHLHGGSCDGEGKARQTPGVAGTVEERTDDAGKGKG